MYFHYFATKGVALWTDMISFYPKVLCVKFDQDSLSGSGEYSQMLTMYFSYFAINYCPFGKGWLFICQSCVELILVEIVPVGLEENMTMWKVYRQTDRQKDKRRSEKLTGASSSVKLKLLDWLICPDNIIEGTWKGAVAL